MTDSNPYAVTPGIESAPESRMNVKLFTAGQVAWGTFLGSPFAGAMLMAINDHRLGLPQRGKMTLLGGGVGTILMLFCSLFLPDSVPSLVIPIGLAWGMHSWAQQQQGKAIATCLAKGGRRASSWLASGISLLCCLVMVAILFGIVLAMPESWLPE